MLEPVGYNAQSQGLGPPQSLLTGVTVDHDTGEIGHFNDPASVLLPIDLNGEAHRERLAG